MNKILNGIIVPMVSPLKDQDQLDIQGLEHLIEHLVDGGVHGVFILGTTGEAPGLSYKLRYELIERTCKQIHKRIPVLVGITDTSQTESLKLTEKAAQYGADAVVSAPPYYFTPTQGDLKRYFISLADQSPLPLFLYNMPSHTKVSFEPDTVKSLANHENIIGIKDSSGDLIYFQKIVQLMEKKPGYTMLMGPEELLMQSVLSGSHGGVPGGANMFPKLYVDMYEAAVSRDVELMESLQKRILQISSTIYSVGTYGAGYLKGLKCALSLMGICSDVLAEPIKSFGDRERGLIRGFLEKNKTESAKKSTAS